MDAARLRRMLDAQEWTCALWHEDDETDAIHPGDELGTIDDGTALVHLSCLRRATAPERTT